MYKRQDEDAVCGHEGKERIVQYSGCPGIVGQMVGHRLTLGEQRLQGDAAYTPFRGLFRRQEGVVYQHVQFAAVQHPDHHRADHAGADDPHLAADIAWKAGGVPSGGLHLSLIHIWIQVFTDQMPCAILLNNTKTIALRCV